MYLAHYLLAGQHQLGVPVADGFLEGWVQICSLLQTLGVEPDSPLPLHMLSTSLACASLSEATAPERPV